MILLRSGEMNVRTAEKGGAVASDVQLDPGATPLERSRLVLLIHGYCNDLADARESYGLFRANFCLAEPKAQPFATDMFRFYWPGDKSWGWLRFASYPLEIRPARHSARVLAKFLRTLSKPVELYLIAHSLGNRVAMELLDDFVQSGVPPAVQLKGICMMAAAVPVSAVRWPGSLHYASLLTRAQVLFSPGDRTLRFAFMPGQGLSFDSFGSQAVGLHGEPLQQWKWSQPMTYGRKKYDHGDYWRKSETAKPVADFLNRSVPATIFKRATLSHSLPPANVLVSHTI